MNQCTDDMRQIIYARDGEKCQYCGTIESAFIIEHVVPADNGGPALPYNLVVACRSCNVKKGSKVWVPKNLTLITRDFPTWQATVVGLADKSSPNDSVRVVLEIDLPLVHQLDLIATKWGALNDGVAPRIDQLALHMVHSYASWYLDQNDKRNTPLE